MTPSVPSAGDPLDAVAEEFLARLRRGERPALSEFTARHPELAERIRDLFPTLAELEVAGPAAGPDAPPPRIGEYRVLREVGRGGMGVVYEAVQESLGRHVALKVLPAGPRGRGTFLERFRREAKAAAKLHHTNIVPVFGVGEAGGVHYYAMQYIHGQGLDAVLAEVRRLRGIDPTPDAPTLTAATPVVSVAQGLLTGHFAPRPDDADTAVTAPPAPAASASGSGLAGQPEARYCREVARLGVQAAEALAHAHAHGILHRDVKPSNLLLDTEGALWVTDFGLAKTNDADDLTGTGDLVGTLRYMAPERFRGAADDRSDVYSLGVTLYELLTLRPPYDKADRLRLVRRIEQGQPPRPRQLDPHIPRDLETVVLKALAAEPGDRYATARALAEDLQRFLADRPVRARRHSLREQAWRWCRRNPTVAALTGAVAALVLAVALGSTVATVWLSAALTRAVNAEREGKLRLWDALKAEAHGTRVVSRREGQRFESLATIAKAVALGRQLGLPPERFDELRNEAIAALTLADLHVTHWWEGLPSGCDHPDFADDLSLYCRSEPDGAVSVRRVDGDTELCRLPAAEGPTKAYLSPDGRFAVQRLSGDGRFAVWRLGPQPELVGRIERPGLQEGVQFHPRRDLFALRAADNAVTVYDLPGVRPVHHLPAEGRPGIIETVFHPTEPLVAQSTYDARSVEVRELATGRVVATWAPPWPGGTGVCAWHPDSHTLAVPQGDGPVTVLVEFDPATRTFGRQRQLAGETPGGPFTRFNRAGDRLLVATDWNDSLQIYDVGTGRQVFEAPPTVTVVKRPRFDPSGRRLAGARRGTQLGLWSVGDGREYRILAPGRATPGGGRPPAFSPDGRVMAANVGDGLTLYDLATGRELAVVPFRPQGINAARAGALAFEPSGALLTNSVDGCFRWPLRSDPSSPERLRLGPPERLPFHEGSGVIALSRDGRVMAQAMYSGYGEGPYAGGWILHPDRPGEVRRVAVGIGMGDADVSPDGRWAAFGSHLTQVLVFETATGREVWRSPVGGNHCRFTPDGCWLATNADGGRLFAVGTWEPGPRLGPGAVRCITPDSRLVVLSMNEGYFRLVEVKSGRELARLEDPERYGGRGAWFAARFTPDGTRFVASAKEGLRVWNLQAIRRELAALRLDWDAPPYPPEDEHGGAHLPLTVEVVGAQLLDPTTRLWWNLLQDTQRLLEAPDDLPARVRRAGAAQRLGWLWLAAYDYTRLLERQPDHRRALLQRGQIALQQGRPANALADFDALLRRDADYAQARYLRAQALIRLDRHREAADDLDRVIPKFPRDLTLYTLRGRCHARLGDHARADADFRKAAELLPDDPATANRLAWQLVTGPDHRRDPAQALPLAEKAVRLAPRQWTNHNTLGVVHYRLGRYAEAIKHLSTSLEHSADQSAAYDLYVLAMCHHRLGDAARATDCFDRAVRWQRQAKLSLDQVKDLNAFRAEAADLLGTPPFP